MAFSVSNEIAGSGRARCFTILSSAAVVVTSVAVWIIVPFLNRRREAGATKAHLIESAVRWTNVKGTVSQMTKNLFNDASVYLSIIIPAYNEEHRIPLCLHATLKLLRDRYTLDKTFTSEVIVVDDGSSDQTVSTVLSIRDEWQPFGACDIRVVQLVENKGKGFACKAGAHCARGAYILLMDADGATQVDEMMKLEEALRNSQTDGAAKDGFVKKGLRDDTCGSGSGAQCREEATSTTTTDTANGLQQPQSGELSGAAPIGGWGDSKGQWPAKERRGCILDWTVEAVDDRECCNNSMSNGTGNSGGFSSSSSGTGSSNSGDSGISSGRNKKSNSESVKSSGEGYCRKERNTANYEIAFGSRRCVTDAGDSGAERRLFRLLLMHAFRFCVNLFVGTHIKDTQCGFKLFSRRAARCIFTSLHINRWAFDIEIVVLAERFAFGIVEVAVNWKEIPGSKLNPFTAAIEMLRDMTLIRIAYETNIWQPNWDVFQNSYLSTTSSAHLST